MMLRVTLLTSAALGLTACMPDVPLTDPLAASNIVCHDPSRGLNPWSQDDACIADHVAQGWMITK